MTAPCSISGAKHYWTLKPYKRYISRGTCDCGAVHFFAESKDKEILRMTEILNQKKGKAGMVLGTNIKNKC